MTRTTSASPTHPPGRSGTALTGECGFTLEHWRALPEGFPAILMDGAFLREPAPTYGHQWFADEIARLLHAALPGRVATSPIDVILGEATALQPDVLVTREGVHVALDGSPECVPILVVEVLSPSTAERDRGPKCAAYLRGGVAEVWLVDPDDRTIEVVTAERRATFAAGETARSAVVPEFELRWPDIEPKRE